MYSVARSPPRTATPRPSSRSLERNFTWARMRSPEMVCAWEREIRERSRSAVFIRLDGTTDDTKIRCRSQHVPVIAPDLRKSRALGGCKMHRIAGTNEYGG